MTWTKIDNPMTWLQIDDGLWRSYYKNGVQVAFISQYEAGFRWGTILGEGTASTLEEAQAAVRDLFRAKWKEFHDRGDLGAAMEMLEVLHFDVDT